MGDSIKKLTILHSNDLHGDFLPKETDGKETGGLSRLSGYVSKIRSEKENVIYAIAGDMFRGSIIDSEFQGLSTIDLMNNLNPDVATIGNHVSTTVLRTFYSLKNVRSSRLSTRTCSLR